MKSELKTRTLQNLADARLANELRVNEEYQRGTKWSLSQKQGLIDSLLRGYQIPLFYVHLEAKTNNFTGEIQTTAWKVDGQQRLAAIIGYRQNEFSLPDPKKAKPGTVLPIGTSEMPSWTGKKFEDLAPDDKARLLGFKLLVVQMTAEHPNEVRDLFIRLQAGTPLTAQEKRDAWPGDFTNFVIQHAGKPGHRLSNPKRFFNLFPRSRGLSWMMGFITCLSGCLTQAPQEGRKAGKKAKKGAICPVNSRFPAFLRDVFRTVSNNRISRVHYVDGLADARKFFAGLAMTIMVRERAEVDFVDLKGATINEFYIENLVLKGGDDGATRVLQVLDRVAKLPGFDSLREGKPLPFAWAFHLALLVDSLEEGRYASVWREDVVGAFITFKQDVAAAQLHYRQNHESLLHYERFGRLLAGSGSDTAEVIRRRHSFLLGQVYSKINLIQLDPNRLFDPLEKEVIWNRDRELCQNPRCERPDRRVPFREATIHHIIEHTVGGTTTLQNGVLICPDCHRNRDEMQRLASHFQEYIRRIYSNPAQQPAGGVVADSRSTAVVGQVDAERDADENGQLAAAGGLKIVIDWGALDEDRETQTISGGPASDVIVTLLVELIKAFGEPMEQQLTEFPVIRFPLARDPTTAFLNKKTGVPFSSIQLPGSDLRFCPQSSTPEKVLRLKELFSRLTLPDGRDFPPGSVEFSIDAV